jgi:6-phosphogluconolactonase (cycloisomerase 2 family)
LFAGEYVYAVNELDNTVTVHATSGNASLPTCRESVLPIDLSVPKDHTMNAAAILLSSDSRFLYITNRLEGNPKGDSLVWFAVSADGSNVERKGEIRTGLDHPRGAALFKHQEQEYLITGSKTEKGAVVYRVDTETGNVQEVARNTSVQHPSCFVILT